MADTVRVELPDDTEWELPKGATGADLVAEMGPKVAESAVAVEVDGRLVDLTGALPDGASLSVVPAGSDAGRDVIRHSTAHVMAQAVLRLWPGARLAIGPVIADGFYYDFELPGGARFSEDDLGRVEAAMRDIIEEDQPFVREELSIEEGLALFDGQPYKQEIIEAVAAGGEEVDAAMRDIVAEDQPFVREELSIAQGLALFEGQPYKQEIIEAVAAGGEEVDAAGSAAAGRAVSCRAPCAPSSPSDRSGGIA